MREIRTSGSLPAFPSFNLNDDQRRRLMDPVRPNNPRSRAGVRYGTNIVRWGIATLATYGKVSAVITIIAR
jgi:hypothetical protein